MWGLYQQNVTPQMGSQVNVLIFIVIIIGGLGSVGGCFIGALLVGLIANYTGFLAPKVALFSNILLMVPILLWRPQGIYPVAKRMRRRVADRPTPALRRSRRAAAYLAAPLLLAIVARCCLRLRARSCFPARAPLDVAAKICVFIVLVASFDLLLGYTGIVCFAHTMFFGIGAYGVAIALTRLGPAWAAVLLGVAARAGLPGAVAADRPVQPARARDLLRHDHARGRLRLPDLLASQLPELTGGEDGLTFKVAGVLSPGSRYRISRFWASLDGKLIAYYLLFVVSAGPVPAHAAHRQLAFRPGAAGDPRKRFSRRGDGLPHRRVPHARQRAFGRLATLAGALLALWLRYNGPDTSLSFEIMIDILLMVVIGGMGTIYGAGAGRRVRAGAKLPAGPAMGARRRGPAGAAAAVRPDRWLLWLGSCSC